MPYQANSLKRWRFGGLFFFFCFVALSPSVQCQEITFSITGVIPVERMSIPSSLFDLEQIELFLVVRPDMSIFIPPFSQTQAQESILVIRSHIEPQTKRLQQREIVTPVLHSIPEPFPFLFSAPRLEIFPTSPQIEVPDIRSSSFFKDPVYERLFQHPSDLYHKKKEIIRWPDPIQVALFDPPEQVGFFETITIDPKTKEMLPLLVFVELGFLVSEEFLISLNTPFFYFHKEMAPIDEGLVQLGLQLGDSWFFGSWDDRHTEFSFLLHPVHFFAGISGTTFHMGGWVLDWPLRSIDLGIAAIENKILPIIRWMLNWPQSSSVGLIIQSPDLYGPFVHMDFGSFYAGFFGGIHMNELDWAWFINAGWATNHPIGIKAQVQMGMDPTTFVRVNLRLDYPLTNTVKFFVSNQLTYVPFETSFGGKARMGVSIGNIDFSLLVDYQDQGVRYGAIIGARF